MKKHGNIDNKQFKHFNLWRKFQLSIVENRISMSFTFLLCALWELVARLQILPPFLLPAPTKIIYTLIQTFPAMLEHLIITVLEAVVGFGVAIIFSLLMALVMDGILVVRKALYPIVITSQTIPIITLAPLFALWFGYGYLPKIVVVVLVCFFPITISLLEGLTSVDREQLDLLRAMGANQIQIYRMVKLPAAMPNFFAGLKIAGTYSVMGAVIGEWVGGKKGLGVYMLRVRHAFATDKVFATIIMITLLSILMLKIIKFAENKLMPWNKYVNRQDEEEVV